MFKCLFYLFNLIWAYTVNALIASSYFQGIPFNDYYYYLIIIIFKAWYKLIK